jgi:hypothetical protein
MITEIIYQCGNILAELYRDKEVSDDDWVHYIKKAMTLSANNEGLNCLKYNALEQFE